MASTPSDCCYASGGRCSMAVDGKSISPRSVNITEINFERDVKSNADGSIYTETKPMPAEADVTISDFCGLDINALMNCPVDVTFDLWDVRRRYYFTRAVIVGRFKLNTQTGEYSGGKVTCNKVTREDY